MFIWNQEGDEIDFNGWKRLYNSNHIFVNTGETWLYPFLRWIWDVCLLSQVEIKTHTSNYHRDHHGAFLSLEIICSSIVEIFLFGRNHMHGKCGLVSPSKLLVPNWEPKASRSQLFHPNILHYDQPKKLSIQACSIQCKMAHKKIEIKALPHEWPKFTYNHSPKFLPLEVNIRLAYLENIKLHEKFFSHTRKKYMSCAKTRLHIQWRLVVLTLLW